MSLYDELFESQIEEEQSKFDDEDFYSVTVYNNDYNTFDEVIFIMQKAVFCSFEVAEHIAWELHNKGQAVVLKAPFHFAKTAAKVIGSIGIKVTVTKVTSAKS